MTEQEQTLALMRRAYDTEREAVDLPPSQRAFLFLCAAIIAQRHAVKLVNVHTGKAEGDAPEAIRWLAWAAASDVVSELADDWGRNLAVAETQFGVKE